MSLLEIILYTLIGGAVITYLIVKLFIKPTKKQNQKTKKQDKATEND